MIILIIAFVCNIQLFAQVKKPHELKKEILQSQRNTQPKTKKGKTAQNNQALPVGATTFIPANPLKLKNVQLIYLEKSDGLYFDQEKNPDVELLKGNVCFRHDNALLYCDSAYFYEKSNFFDAFGNVRIVQGDTLTAYGDVLHYDGNTKMARLKNNVRMVNRNTTLVTDSMDYDRLLNLAYYFTGGKITDGKNKLTSIWGQYSPATHQSLFKENVELTNPDFTMKSDTLLYNTKTHVANIVGKTHIIYKNETDIYSKKGWYNTSTEQMMLLDRSLVKHKGGKSLTADTIYYDKKIKYAESYSNVMMIDTVQKSTLYGHYSSYDEVKQSGLATDSALFVDWSTKDTLYLSADTLANYKDSIYNVVNGFMHVRFFRPDVQGLSDSLTYSARDSIMHLNGDPVLWAEGNQLMGNKITAYTKNKKINQVDIEKSAIAIQHDTLDYYNQLSGKEIIAYLDSGEVKKVNVNGNAETIYFPKDDKTNQFIGVNKTLSSFITAYLKDKKIDKVVLTSASSGVLYPLKDMSENDLYLPNFNWYEKERPKDYFDVFTRYPKLEKTKRQESTKRPAFPGTSSGEDKSNGTKGQKEQKDQKQGRNPVNNNFSAGRNMLNLR